MAKRDMSGILGKNKWRKNDDQPSHSGKCTINGQDLWISAWVKDGDDGSKFFSLAFKPVEKKEAPASSGSPADDDDIPF